MLPYSSEMQFILTAPEGSIPGDYRKELLEAGFDRLIGRSAQIRALVQERCGQNPSFVLR